MPFNGSGGFVALSPPDFPAVAGTTILAATFNNTLNDVFLGFANCITRDGQSPATANLPMNSFKHTGAAAASASGQYLVYGQNNAVLGTGLTVGTAFTAGSGASFAGTTTFATTLNKDAAPHMISEKYAADNAGVGIFFRKSRHATLGSHTIVQNADQVGVIAFEGSDGTAFRPLAYIIGEVNGTPGASDMPGQLRFNVTPDGSATPAEAMRISSDKSVTFSGATKPFREPVSFSATPTFNFAARDVISFGTLTGNVTAATVSNIGDGRTVLVMFAQDGTGGRTVTFSGGGFIYRIAGSVGLNANQISIASITQFDGGSIVVSWVAAL